MVNCLKFYANVSDGDEVERVPINDELADQIPAGKVLSLTDAVAMGINPEKVVDDGGLRQWKSHEEVLRLRRMLAVSKGQMQQINGRMQIPSQDSLMERVRHPDLCHVVTFFEDAFETSQVSESLEIPEIPGGLEVHQDLPMIGLQSETLSPISGVYKPTVLDNEEYRKPDGSRSKDFPSAMAAERIIQTYALKRFRGEFFLFRKHLGYYEPLKKPELLVLIDEAVGAEIREANKAKAYTEIETFVRNDVRLEVTQDQLLLDTFWAFSNGIFDVKKEALMENKGEYFMREAIMCRYSGQNSCPIFDAFLEAVTGRDPLLLELIWQTIGYILSPDNKAKTFFTFVGPKDTGKSLLANILIRFFPETAISLLGATDFSGRFDTAEVEGKRLNVCMDMSDSTISSIAVGKIKSLTGGDMIRSDVKYKSSVAFRNSAKIVFCSNTLLRTEKPDEAFFDRQILIPFRYPVPKEHQDKNLEAKMAQELSGIASKAILAYKRLVAANYVFPQCGMHGLDAQGFDFNKIVRSFAKECCEFSENDDIKVSTEALFAAFDNFCASKRFPQMDKNAFSELFIQLKRLRKCWGYPVLCYIRNCVKILIFHAKRSGVV